MALLLHIVLLLLASVRIAYAAKGCNQMQAECILVVGIGHFDSCANRCQAFASHVHDKAIDHCVGRDGMSLIAVKNAQKFAGNPPIKVCTCIASYTVWRLSRGCDINNYYLEVCIYQSGSTFGDSDISEHDVYC